MAEKPKKTGSEIPCGAVTYKNQQKIECERKYRHGGLHQGHFLKVEQRIIPCQWGDGLVPRDPQTGDYILPVGERVSEGSERK